MLGSPDQCAYDRCRGCVDCMPVQTCPGCGDDAYDVAAGRCFDCGPIVECVACDEPMPEAQAQVVDDDWHCLACALRQSLGDGRAA